MAQNDFCNLWLQIDGQETVTRRGYDEREETDPDSRYPQHVGHRHLLACETTRSWSSLNWKKTGKNPQIGQNTTFQDKT